MKNPTIRRYREIRLILGDQLNLQHSWFKNVDEDILYVLMEILPESQYVTHHIQKIVGIFINMRSFAEALDLQGHHVKYFKIGDADNNQSFDKNLLDLVKHHSITSGAYIEPDEYRLDQQLEEDFRNLMMPCTKVSAEHFFTDRDELSDMFPGRSSFLMETFYRKMRKKHEVLMNGGKPTGDQWNFDKENRNKLPKGHKPPAPLLFSHDVNSVVEEIKQAGIQCLGEIDADQFTWPRDRKEALKVLDYFAENLLVNFGTYQDAMSNHDSILYHSRLSFAMNLKVLSPKEVVRKVEQYWKDNQNKIRLSQVEGFIRQILGWREYMRGIYWKHMPSYEKLNFFEFKRNLPDFFWTGDTKMNCLEKTIKQSLTHGYAHHIQRLMITGNFSLLCGVEPSKVDAWYLGMYTDAFQWVEITNTIGMSQFADGGIVGTKPYVSSASYINKMSDYCSNCQYDPKKKTGENACPFNSLYWRFLAVNEDKLIKNQRMSMMYNLWHKMDRETKNDLIDQANYYLDYVEEL